MRKPKALGFLADFIYPMWLVKQPPDMPGDNESKIGLRMSYWDAVYHRETSDGVALTGYRQGVFQFTFPDSRPGSLCVSLPERPQLSFDVIHPQIRYANCFALCYHSALQSIDKVDLGYFFVGPNDLFFMGDDPGYPVYAGPIHRLAGHSELCLPIGTTRVEVLDQAFGLFERFHSMGYDTVQLVALLNQAAYGFQSYDIQVSLVLAWTVSEVLLNGLWGWFIQEQAKLHTGQEASKNLVQSLTSRDYTASVMTEVLAVTGVVSQELRGRLNAVRKARNTWVHSMGEPSIETARLALHVARDMIERVLSIRVELDNPGSAQVWGGRQR